MDGRRAAASPDRAPSAGRSSGIPRSRVPVGTVPAYRSAARAAERTAAGDRHTERVNATAARPTWALLLIDGIGAAVFLAVTIALGQIRITDVTIVELNQPVAFTVSAALLGGAIVVRRVRPSISLALAWASTIVHMAAALDVAATQLGLLVVLYSTARYGSTRVMRLAGVSAGVGAVIAVAYLQLIGSWSTQVFPLAFGDSSRLQLLAFAALTVVALAAPWALGLLVRTLRDERESRRRRAAAEVEAQRAQQIVELERARTELARDVHDIVGHSLAVIIAQAESVRFLERADAGAPPSAAETVTATIADTARRSLAEVRGVLERTAAFGDAAAGSAPSAAKGGDRGQVTISPKVDLPDLEQLISDVATARPTLIASVTGQPLALDEPTAVAAYRVAQELLTNALKHGDSAGELGIARHWSADALEIIVTNAVAPVAAPDDLRTQPERAAAGQGLTGVRDRLAAIGGRLELESAPDAFSARASIPIPTTTQERSE